MRHARMRATLAGLFALALGLGISSPAHAANLLLHKRTSSATSIAPLDSTLWSVTTSASGALASRDTLTGPSGTINTDNFSSVPPIDSLSDRGAVAGAGRGFPHNLWLTVEITGGQVSIDSLYAFVQYSQGQVPSNTGQTNIYTAATLGDPNSNPANWRWYDAVGSLSAMTGGLIATANQAGTQTFVFPIPCAASDVNSWLAGSNLRVVVIGDNNAAAKGAAVRAWLTWRNQ